MRARLVRLGAQRSNANPVLEPLFRIVRTTHPKADLRMIEWTGLRLVPGDRSGGTLDGALALGDLAQERRAIGIVGAGDPRRDRRGAGRPATACRQRRGQAQSGP